MTSETALLILCLHDHICDTEGVILTEIFVDSCLLPVQSLCEEVISGTPGPEDPH